MSPRILELLVMVAANICVRLATAGKDDGSQKLNKALSNCT